MLINKISLFIILRQCASSTSPNIPVKQGSEYKSTGSSIISK